MQSEFAVTEPSGQYVHIGLYMGYRPPLGLKLGHWKDKTHIPNFTEDHLVNRCRFRHDNEVTSWFEFGNTFYQPNMVSN